MPFLQEQTLKSIVYEINELIKRTKKNQQNNRTISLENLISQFYCKNPANNPENIKCEGYFLHFKAEGTAPYQEDCHCQKIYKTLNKYDVFRVLNEKFEPSWPLKKGMVNSKLIAWQMCASSLEANQRAIAFMIKCVALCKLKQESSTLNTFSLPLLFNNELCTLFFWSQIKKYYINNADYENKYSTSQPYIFFNEILPKNKVIILSLEDTFFRLRSGSNFELQAFEHFINDLILSNNGLIIFSRQNLIPNKNQELYNISKYSVTFKKNLDEQKFSLREAMEPEFKIAKDERFIAANKIGAFDRIIELLTLGQQHIQKIEKDFLEWKRKSEN